MKVRFVVGSCADLQRVLEGLERNVVAVGSVEVILLAIWWIRHPEDNFEVAVARAIEVALSGPPVERFLIMRQGDAPVSLKPAYPEEVSQRFMRFRPYQVAIFFLLRDANQF